MSHDKSLAPDKKPAAAKTAKSLLFLIGLPTRTLQKIVTPRPNCKALTIRKCAKATKMARSQAHLDWVFPAIMLVFCLDQLIRDRSP